MQGLKDLISEKQKCSCISEMDHLSFRAYLLLNSSARNVRGEDFSSEQREADEVEGHKREERF